MKFALSLLHCNVEVTSPKHGNNLSKQGGKVVYIEPFPDLAIAGPLCICPFFDRQMLELYDVLLVLLLKQNKKKLINALSFVLEAENKYSAKLIAERRQIVLGMMKVPM